MISDPTGELAGHRMISREIWMKKKKSYKFCLKVGGAEGAAMLHSIFDNTEMLHVYVVQFFLVTCQNHVNIKFCFCHKYVYVNLVLIPRSHSSPL